MNDFGVLSAGDPDYFTRAFLLATAIVFFIWVIEQFDKDRK